jgi:hypothetical protein
LKARQWNAFDATHLNAKRSGFRYLGTFSSLNLAKAAVEESIAPHDKKPAPAAAAVYEPGGMWIS